MGHFLSYYMLSVNMLVNLLSHAEMTKDVVEGFLGGDLSAGDVGKDVEGETEIFGKEVTA